MVKVCEHTFEDEDPAHPGYSAREVDLYPSVGEKGEAYSMRHNKIDDLYEIFDFKTGPDPYTDEAVQYSDPDIEQVIDEAYRLEVQAEGDSSFEYGHTRLHCPDEILDDLSNPFE